MMKLRQRRIGMNEFRINFFFTKLSDKNVYIQFKHSPTRELLARGSVRRKIDNLTFKSIEV